MSVHDKYKHWTQAGTLSTLSKFQIEELRKNHSVEIYHRRVMIRRKPSRQLTLVQPHKRLETMGDFAPKVKQAKHKTSWYRFHKWLRKVLLVIITFELVIGYATFNAKQLIGVEAKIDISPVTFTDDEIKELIKANPNAVIEPKYQHLQKEVKTEKPAETSVEGTIRKYFGAEADKAITCFKAESGLRPQALNTRNKNGTWDMGVAQINSIHCKKLGTTDRNECKEKLFDVETNIKMAKSIYDGRGFNAWYACKQFWSK